LGKRSTQGEGKKKGRVLDGSLSASSKVNRPGNGEKRKEPTAH